MKYEDISGTTNANGNLMFPSALQSKNVISAKEITNNYATILSMGSVNIRANDTSLQAFTNKAVTVRVFYLE